MRVLLETADERAALVIARIAVRVFFPAAERFARLLRVAAFGMRVLLKTAGQDPGSVASVGVNMVFVRVGTGQTINICRNLRLLEAGVAMLVLQHLHFAADQAAVFIVASRDMAVKDKFRSPTSQLSASFRIAGIRMMMLLNCLGFG